MSSAQEKLVELLRKRLSEHANCEGDNCSDPDAAEQLASLVEACAEVADEMDKRLLPDFQVGSGWAIRAALKEAERD
jgi:hypothetical protein